MEKSESNEIKENILVNDNSKEQGNKENEIIEKKNEFSTQENKDNKIENNENMKNEKEIKKKEEKLNVKEMKNNEKDKSPEKYRTEKKQKKKEYSLPKKIDKTNSNKIKSNKKNNISADDNNEDQILIHSKFRKESILNYIRQKKQQELEECSFRPKINKKIGFEINNVDTNKVEKEKETYADVVDRLMQWNERVQKKKNDNRNKKAETARDGCTFNPKLNLEVPKFENTKINGTKKYLDRIKNSREIQKQKEEKLNPDYDMLYNKYYKKKEKTVLDKNKKLTKKTYQNYINAIHNALMNDDDD